MSICPLKSICDGLHPLRVYMQSGLYQPQKFQSCHTGSSDIQFWGGKRICV